MVPDIFYLYSQPCPESKCCENKSKHFFCFLWMWSSETRCCHVKVNSGLPGQAESICGVTLSHVCPGNSMWIAGTQNQSMVLGMAKAFADDFDWQTPGGTNNWGVFYFSSPRMGGSAAGAVTAGWFELASPAKPPKSSLDRRWNTSRILW